MEVFSCLDTLSLKNVREVCKRWQRVASDPDLVRFSFPYGAKEKKVEELKPLFIEERGSMNWHPIRRPPNFTHQGHAIVNLTEEDGFISSVCDAGKIYVAEIDRPREKEAIYSQLMERLSRIKTYKEKFLSWGASGLFFGEKRVAEDQLYTHDVILHREGFIAGDIQGQLLFYTPKEKGFDESLLICKQSPCFSLTPHDDGFIAGYADASIQVWSHKEGEGPKMTHQLSYQGEEETGLYSVRALYSIAEDLFVSGHSNGSLILWKKQGSSWRRQKEIKVAAQKVHQIIGHPLGLLVASDEVLILSVEKGCHLFPLAFLRAPVFGEKVSRILSVGSRIFAGYDSGRVYEWFHEETPPKSSQKRKATSEISREEIS